MTGMAEVSRVFMVILENTDYATAVEQPYLAYLARHGALLANYHAIAHPSQPNYIALTAGSTYNVSSDDPITVNATHIGDLLDARNLSWRVYAENYPGGCFTGNQFGNPQTGQYLRKHTPFISYADVQSNTDRCNGAIVDANTLDADVYTGNLPRFSLYIPNSYNDGHQTSVRFADAWLKTRFDPFLSDPRFISGTLFIVVFDEAESSGTGTSNNVYCVLYGAGIKQGVTSYQSVDHYNLLRTIEDALHIGTTGQHDAAATSFTDIWR